VRDGDFGKPIVLNEDTKGSRGFEGIGVAADGSLVAAWIESGPTSRTRVARIGVDGTRESRVLDERSCPCCRLAVATDATGSVALLWRDESEASVRDMVVSFAEADTAFSAPVRVSDDRWVLEACPHRGGALAFAPDGRVAVAWYTEGKIGRPQLLLAVGDANGFGAPLAIHRDAVSQPDRVALALDRDGRGIVLWERRTAVRSEIAARAISADGARLGPVRVVSQTLHAGHPQVRVSPTGRFVAAWSEESFPTQRTVVAALESTAP
jgi:hypothetical protein